MPTKTPIIKAPTAVSSTSVVKNFLFAGVASSVGATAVFPLDKIKTRIQNCSTPNSAGGTVRQLAGGIANIKRSEGLRGLYRGLGPQLVGITPEKAVKLSSNDLFRRFLGKIEGKSLSQISMTSELVAALATGAVQVFVTTPYEALKIRMQMYETRQVNGNSLALIRELGLRGLYRGLSATALRDLPFNAIYFSCYFGSKKAITRFSGNQPTKSQVFVAGIFAGTLAAAIDTPADTVKTRLQSGNYEYKNVRDAFKTILREEGPSALIKGMVPRVLIIAPLFSITFTVFDTLQRYFGVAN